MIIWEIILGQMGLNLFSKMRK